eukprot:3791255-Pyramimonas_sp.AAC.1
MAKSSGVAKWGGPCGRLIEFSGMIEKDRAMHLRRRGWDSLQRQVSRCQNVGRVLPDDAEP